MSTGVDQVLTRDEYAARPLWNPYVAGVALGLVLLSTYLVFGRGLGASGALARFSAMIAHQVAPGWVESSGVLGGYLAPGTAWWDDWLIFEVVGVSLGALAAGLTSGRFGFGIDRGPRISDMSRLAMAMVGGIVVGIGARLAQGCTSGQALSGGATLALGSWAFMFAVFGGAYGVAYFVRRLWV
ncbi:MAG: YeeE/YedE family protein [Deltaproteobacteria bacterium]|nr:YeeE/YedE family protein [Deltaproteobacteria bacterium]